MSQRSTYGAVLALTLCSAIVAACLSSADLADWADNLPDSAASRTASTCAHALDDTMHRLRLASFAATLQDTTRKAEARKFSPEEE